MLRSYNIEWVLDRARYILARHIKQMEKESRKLQLFRAGGADYAVPNDVVMTIADWRQPAALPHSPAAVLGVVSIRGRMLTVLDLTNLVGAANDAQWNQILALRGDEQLALAISKPGEVVEFPENEREEESKEGLVAQVLKHQGVDINILNVKQLFPTAIQGRERRRRRF